MAKSRQEKIASYEEKIAQLQNQKKQELQKFKEEERRARTKRFCSRHGLLEKYMPDLITITDEQFEMFIKRGINTSYGQKTLAEIIAKPPHAAPQQHKEVSQAAITGKASDTAASDTGQVG